MIDELRSFPGLSYSMFKMLEVREVLTGTSSDAELDRAFSWFNMHAKNAQKQYPTNVVSMDNEEIKTSLYDVYRKSGRNKCDWPRPMAKYLEDSIRDGLDRYLIQKLTVQEKLADFLEEIPVCTGLGVQGDVEDVNYLYSLFSARTIEMQGYVDLVALSVLSGWELYTQRHYNHGCSNLWNNPQ